MAIEDLFKQPIKVINLGLPDFYETLVNIGVECRQVEIELTNERGEHSDE